MSDNTHATAEAGGGEFVFPCERDGCAVWWSQTGSNRRPPACKAGALPTELWPRASQHRSATEPIATRGRERSEGCTARAKVVGLGRFELPTSRLSSARSNQLSYKPEPGVSGQKPAIRCALRIAGRRPIHRILMTDSWSARSRRKRNEDGGVPPMDLTGKASLKKLAVGPDVSKRSDRDA